MNDKVVLRLETEGVIPRIHGGMCPRIDDDGEEIEFEYGGLCNFFDSNEIFDFYISSESIIVGMVWGKIRVVCKHNEYPDEKGIVAILGPMSSSGYTFYTKKDIDNKLELFNRMKKMMK